MNINYYQLAEGAFITPIDWPGIESVQQDKDPKHQYWLEVEAITPAELEENLNALNLHPLIIEDCISPDHSTLIDRYLDAVYIEIPTNAAHEYGEVAYLSIICLPDLIMTVRRGDVAQLPEFITSLKQYSRLTVGNTANLLYLLIDYFIDKTITQSLVYRKQINLLEKQVVGDLDDVDPNSIIDLKRQLTQLESICEDQLYCAKSLVTHDNPVINTAGQEVYFNDLVSAAEQGLKSITRLNGRVKDLQDNFTLQHHEFSEKRLRVLTIISAIFLPLTFITGFFGMNFVNMELLGVAYGSMIAIAIMVIISLSLLWYFNSRGWFD